MKITPLETNYVVQEIKRDKVTKGGIHLPDNAAQGEQGKGVVVALPAKFTKKASIIVGDRVIYNRYAGVVVEDGENVLRILDKKEILAIVEE